MPPASPAFPAPALACTGLACRRGDRLLFAGLDLALEGGQALHVAGANGVGKSSLMRLLAGLGRPFSGTVERRGAVGLVDERLALDATRPLGSALAFWARIDGVAGDDLAAAASRMGLDDLMDVPVRWLSTGQKKRAALTRLLALRAPIWLLDEPLNGLDTAGVALVEELAAQHCAQGGLCVVASHQPFALPGMARLALAEFAA